MESILAAAAKMFTLPPTTGSDAFLEKTRAWLEAIPVDRAFTDYDMVKTQLQFAPTRFKNIMLENPNVNKIGKATPIFLSLMTEVLLKDIARRAPKYFGTKKVVQDFHLFKATQESDIFDFLTDFVPPQYRATSNKETSSLTGKVAEQLSPAQLQDLQKAFKEFQASYSSMLASAATVPSTVDAEDGFVRPKKKKKKPRKRRRTIEAEATEDTDLPAPDEDEGELIPPPLILPGDDVEEEDEISVPSTA